MTVHVKNWHAPSCSSEASLSTFLHFEALFGNEQEFFVIENKDEKHCLTSHHYQFRLMTNN